MRLIFGNVEGTVRAMLKAVFGTLRFITLILGGHKQIALENAALRQQLEILKREQPRPKLRHRDRLFWMCLMKIWKQWRTAIVIVQPATVVNWQRRRFKHYWWKLSQRKGPGRPRVSAEVRTLVRTMAAANVTWGAPRIHGELVKLGFEISERTVSRLMPKQHKKPSQTWKTFLTNHTGQLVSIDFFIVPTLQLKVLFVFVVLAHQRRRVLHFNVTEHPTAQWTAQQIIEAFREDAAPRYLIRDRDGVYGRDFQTRVHGMGIEEVLTAPKSPWQNPFAERLIGSIRRDCLNHVIVLGERHLKWILQRYFRYYLDSRTHLSLKKDTPNPRAIQSPETGSIVGIPEVGGLHHRYERRAA
jgi:putative transposase